MIKLDSENLHTNEIGVAKVKEQLDPIKEVDCMIAESPILVVADSRIITDAPMRLTASGVGNLLDLINPKVLREKTEEIIKIIEEIPKADEIVAMLEKVHGVKSLEDIGFTPDMKEKTARVAPYIRDRIIFLRILKFYDFYDDMIK